MAFDSTDFISRLKAGGKRAQDAARQATAQFAEHVIGDAQQRAPVGGPPTTPRDPAPGTLQGSGTVGSVTVTGESVEAEIGFNTPYAAVQHENLEFAHNVGGAKFLENAIKENAPKFGEFVAAKVKAAMDGGGGGGGGGGE